MDRSEEVKQYSDFCHRYVRTEKIVRVVVITVCAVSFLGGMAGIVYSVINNSFDHLFLFGGLASILPLVLAIGYFILLATYGVKRYDRFIAKLYDSNMSADAVLQLGKETGLDLFSLALQIRCIKELKMTGIPEWCFKDGVLPTEK